MTTDREDHPMTAPDPQPPAAPETDVREALAKAIRKGVEDYGNVISVWQSIDAARALLASDWLASHVAATADRVRRETAGGIAAAIEGSIEAHRNAGNRAIVAALAPLPDLAREAGR